MIDYVYDQKTTTKTTTTITSHTATTAMTTPDHPLSPANTRWGWVFYIQDNWGVMKKVVGRFFFFLFTNYFLNTIG
jgi:hypothetical protein